MVIQLHEDQLGQIRVNNDLSELFPIFNGVKQGCVLAPTLFSTFFSMMLRQATRDLDGEKGVCVSTVCMAAYSTYGAFKPTPRPRKG